MHDWWHNLHGGMYPCSGTVLLLVALAIGCFLIQQHMYTISTTINRKANSAIHANAISIGITMGTIRNIILCSISDGADVNY